MYARVIKESEKKDALPFYISLVFFVFPIYGIIAGEYRLYVLWPTLMAICVYLYLVHGKNKILLWVSWACLLGYISYMCIFVSAPNILFMFYPSNIIVWKFNDKIKSIRFISFALVINVCMIYVFFVDNKATDKLTILIFYTLCFGTFFLQKKIKELDEIKNERIKRNEYINSLLAENERNRIARDLHDTVGHIFVTLKVKSELAMKLIEKGNVKEAQKELDDIAKISKKSMDETRAIVSALKFRTVSDALENIKSVLDGAGISYKIHMEESLDNSSLVVQSQISMILQEGINNVIKHSRARNVEIELKKEKRGQEKKIHVIISDDGIGFQKITGAELKSLRERVSSKNGEIKIIHQKNPTKIKATLRVDSMEKEEKLRKLELGDRK